MSLKSMNLKEEYRSDVDDIIAEFFFPCLSNCIEYDRCVNYLSIQTLATIAMAFDNFNSGKAKLRMITGHRFKIEDLNLLTKLFSEKFTKSFDGKFIKNSKIQKLQDIVNNGQIELKIAIPNSEHVTDAFSERIGILKMIKTDKLHLQEHQKNHFPVKQEILNQLMSLHHGMIKQESKEK